MSACAAAPFVFKYPLLEGLRNFGNKVCIELVTATV